MYNEVIESRLKKLEAIVKNLETLSNKAIEDFENDFILASALEHNLQVAIQCVLDIGNHIISIENLEKPNDYKDIILILGKNQIIPKKFADAIYKMAGLRNLIIHEYLEIDIIAYAKEMIAGEVVIYGSKTSEISTYQLPKRS